MKEKEVVKQVFAKNKDAYITSSTHANQEDLNQIIEWIKPKKDMVALDIATGGGHVAKKLATDVQYVYATDLTKEMLQNTANHLAHIKNIQYTVADAEKLPFNDNGFDIVTCRIAAHHFPQPDKFIKEVSRVLNKGGTFLFIDNIASEISKYDTFINTIEKVRDISHIRSLKVSEWKQYLAENNLNLEREEVRKKTLPFVEWINRTQPNESVKLKIENMLLSASQDLKTNFDIRITNNKIKSFAIDEWIALCKKY